MSKNERISSSGASQADAFTPPASAVPLSLRFSGWVTKLAFLYLVLDPFWMPFAYRLTNGVVTGVLYFALLIVTFIFYYRASSKAWYLCNVSRVSPQSTMALDLAGCFVCFAGLFLTFFMLSPIEKATLRLNASSSLKVDEPPAFRSAFSSSFIVNALADTDWEPVFYFSDGSSLGTVQSADSYIEGACAQAGTNSVFKVQNQLFPPSQQSPSDMVAISPAGNEFWGSFISGTGDNGAPGPFKRKEIRYNKAKFQFALPSASTNEQLLIVRGYFETPVVFAKKVNAGTFENVRETAASIQVPVLLAPASLKPTLQATRAYLLSYASLRKGLKIIGSLVAAMMLIGVSLAAADAHKTHRNKRKWLVCVSCHSKASIWTYNWSQGLCSKCQGAGPKSDEADALRDKYRLTRKKD